VLTVCTWLYGLKWAEHYVDRLFNGVRRNTKHPVRCVLISDRPVASNADLNVQFDAKADADLVSRLGCLIRMRMFDRHMQEHIGVQKGDRIVNVDVDAVIVGEIDPLFAHDDEFRIMQGFNSTNPCPFNGSLWTFRAGERHDVWDDFSFKNYRELGVPFHAIPDDQGWLHYKFPKASAYGPADGVYCFKKRTWPGRDETGNSLPAGARIVAFPGRDPMKFRHLEWVQRHWC
jgi:hypothetical protein